MYPLVFNHETGQYDQNNYMATHSHHTWGHWNSHHLYPVAPVVSMAASLQEPQTDQVGDIINQTAADEKQLTAY